MERTPDKNFKELLLIHQKRLDLLELQAAAYGISTPPHILIEIDDIRDKIKDIERKLQIIDSQLQLSSSLPDIETNKINVFICHSSGDKYNARELYQHLIIDGFGAWLDEEKLLPGQDWAYEIPKAVRHAHVVIVCLSKDSITKEGYVQKEIKIALDVADEKPEGIIFIIPAKFEECAVPDRLSRWQWVNLFEENGYSKLRNALKLREKNLQEKK